MKYPFLYWAYENIWRTLYTVLRLNLFITHAQVSNNIVGFLGCQINSSANMFIGHSFSGALHLWYKNKDDQHWRPGVTVGGHASSVEDLDWEPFKGRYLITTGHDQTTRIHAPWKQDQVCI